ncbi:MAG: TetR/AcrR family transcriptional regulator [Candidatus Thorarchaeota archaeon]
MPTKSRKFRRDKISKVNSIVQTTAALIIERGYSGFSVDEIPDRANLSIGTVYRYFPKGKSDILLEILNRTAKTLLELITQEKISEGTFHEFWDNIIMAVLRGHREGAFILTETDIGFLSNPPFPEIVEAVYSDFLQKLAGQTRGIETFTSLTKGEFVSKFRIAFRIVSMLVRYHVKTPEFKTDESLVKYLTKVCLLTYEMDE